MDGRRIAVRLACAVVLAGTGTGQGRAQPAEAPAGERMAYRFVDNVVRVTMVDAAGRLVDEGYGFVFGARGRRLYIATADHVVHGEGLAQARPQVVFHADQGDPVAATVPGLGLRPAEGDLAILEVTRPDDLELHWIGTMPTADLNPGTRAWRIGKRQRWVPAGTPGTLSGRNGNLLQFDDLDTPRGSSGGPVVGEGGVIGMVTADSGASGSSSQVLPIDTIRGMVRDWDLPWNLVAPAAAVASEPPPPPLEPQPGQPQPIQPQPEFRQQPAVARRMQYYGGEAEDFGVFPQGYIQINVGSPTPTNIPGGRVITTQELRDMIATARSGQLRFTLFDVLAGPHRSIDRVGHLPGLGDGYVSPARIASAMAYIRQSAYGDMAAPVVFFCQGPRCWESYNAALRAMQAGFTNVLWYRGGLQAWSAAGLPMDP